MKNHVLPLVLALFALTAPALSGKNPPPPPVPPVVPFVRLLATPEKFDGKQVVVYAQILVTYDGQGAFASRESATHPSNGIWIDGDFSNYVLRDKELWYQGRIAGTFRANKRGATGVWSGTIEQIGNPRLERLPDLEAPKEPEAKPATPPAAGAPTPAFPGAVTPPASK